MNPVSPKVTAAGLTGLVITAIVGVLSAVTPDMFEFAGDFAAPLATLIVAVGSAIAGYYKVDPARVPSFEDVLDPHEEANDPGDVEVDEL